MKQVLITGGAGFIGLNYIKHILQVDKLDIVVVDKLTYASNPKELIYTMGIENHCIDIADKQSVELLFSRHEFSHVIHFAAESHVDRSIQDCKPFVDSNIIGTINLLEQSVKNKVQKFLHISTDEVFGEAIEPNKFNEESKIEPRNPYSASKASAEHFVMAYGNTYGLPYTIINSSNNYGPWQHPEKLIPLTINRILRNKNIPVYGNGQQIRDWIYVKDSVTAIHRVFHAGAVNTRYCIGGENETKNIDLVNMIVQKMNADRSLIEHVTDRLGHDVRYSTDISKIKNELGWSPKYSLSNGLDETIYHEVKNDYGNRSRIHRNRSYQETD